MVANMSVLLCVAAYGAASLALLRLSGAAPEKSRLLVRAIAICAAAFCVWLIASTDIVLLALAAAAVVVALVAYPLVRMRKSKIAAAAAGSSTV